MTPWPRKLANYPIILIAIVLQYVWLVAIAYDAEALHTTGVNMLTNPLPPKLQQPVVIGALAIAATSATLGFWARRRISTLLCLIPQLFMLYVSAGGAIEAIYRGRFADGVMRAHAFLVVDQASLVLIAIFYTWAVVLIMRHVED